ncbi:Short-chain dehydrogenase/reductase family protein [Mycena sanguinolenta]|uniref:Short-chain dehydrogenase/reductase family protein n=1 Tax=Mycena sanguinolenta TaxID=230812 RepID=A0A8H6XLR6_9AGAR|nr:Short-chain dehydrogenase/reductase family protein [Mycena sanguinolenta]
MVLILAEFGVLSFNLYHTYIKQDNASLNHDNASLQDLVLRLKQELVPRVPAAALGFQLFTLFLLVLCRALTMWTSPEKLLKQRFDFLGGCTGREEADGSALLYSLFERSMRQPLVRGEGLFIKMLRIITLLFVAIAGSAYLVNVVILRPVYNSQTATQTVLGSMIQYVSGPVNITMAFPRVSQMNKSAIVVSTPGDTTSKCPVNDFIVAPPALPASLASLGSKLPASPYVTFIAECNGTWETDFNNGLEISINFNGTPTIAYVFVGEGDMTKTLPLIEPILLVPGSHILVSLTLTLRTFLSNSPFDFLSRSQPQPVAMNKISTVQPDPLPSSSELTTATLGLIRVYQGLTALTAFEYAPVELRNEFRDPSVLDGLSSVGGLWTFANGAFSFLFGANLLYFFLGRRPLSALGLLHIFQQGTLRRKWHEDFPALRTEGGLPGSETAGIVAFLRERLVDLGDSDEDDILREKRSNDVEAQRA